MKRYEAYKPVTSRWAKQLPFYWEFQKIAEVFIERKENNDPIKTTNILSLTNTRGVIPYSDKGNLGNKAKNDIRGYRLAYPGDIVLNSMNVVIGSVGLSQYYGAVSPVYYMLYVRNNTKYNVRYYNYVFQDKIFQGGLNGLGNGILEIRMRIPMSKLKYVCVPVPPRDEQDQIVRYLDWQVSKINRLITAKRKQIQLLKERQKTRIAHIVQCGLDDNAVTRDSGIEYIGIVPAHWLVLQNRRLFHSMNRIFQGTPTVLSLSQKDGLIPYSEMSERSLHTSSYENWQLVHENDLVLNRFKAHLGVFFASKYEGIVTFHYGVYEPRRPLVTKYYEALYHTPAYCRVYAGQSRGMTVGLQNLSDTNFYSAYTVYPPYEEQVEIVSEISQIEKQHSQIIASIVSQIEMLQDLRTRLISDVVTGQIDVRGIEVPDYEHYDEAPENATEESSDSDYDTEE